jgi:predicted AlkP superfamily phosphohydrolase/phosphomutase
MPSAPRFLVVGLDAMERDLIQSWADDGTLPTFQRIKAHAEWGYTLNPPRRYSGAVWPSFVTGVCPHRHGQYFQYRTYPGSYRPVGVRHEADAWRPVWEAISQAGRRVAVIDVPYVPLSRNLNGIQIIDWAMHDREFTPVRAWPPALAREVQGRFSDVISGNCDVPRQSSRAFAMFRDRLVAQVAMKARYAEHVLEDSDWDLVVIVLDEAHCVGHQCWHLHDPTHPRHDRTLARELGDPIKDVYAAIDAALGAILSHAGHDTTVLVLASHGMGPLHDGNFMLDEILWRLDEASSGWVRRLLDRVGVSAVGPPTRVPHPGESVWWRLHRRANEAAVDWGRRTRRAFALWQLDERGWIRINLPGRPGTDREFRNWLEDRLRELVDADTGQSLVAEIVPAEAVNDEGYRGDEADLYVCWAQPYVRSVWSPSLGMLKQTYLGNRTGDHRRDGLFFIMHSDRRRPHRLTDPVAVTSFAPMIADTLGVLPPLGDLPDPLCEACRRPGP